MVDKIDYTAITRSSGADQTMTPALTWLKIDVALNATALRDPLGMWDGTNKRFVIPAGVTRVRPGLALRINSSAADDNEIIIEKNAGGVQGGGDVVGRCHQQLWEQYIYNFKFFDVVEGDTVEAFFKGSSIRNLTGGDPSRWFELQVLEYAAP